MVDICCIFVLLLIHSQNKSQMSNLILKTGSERKHTTSTKEVDGQMMEVVSGYSHELENGGHLFFCGMTGCFNQELHKRIIGGEFGKFTTQHDVEENSPNPSTKYFYITQTGL